MLGAVGAVKWCSKKEEEGKRWQFEMGRRWHVKLAGAFP